MKNSTWKFVENEANTTYTRANQPHLPPDIIDGEHKITSVVFLLMIKDKLECVMRKHYEGHSRRSLAYLFVNIMIKKEEETQRYRELE